MRAEQSGSDAPQGQGGLPPLPLLVAQGPRPSAPSAEGMALAVPQDASSGQAEGPQTDTRSRLEGRVPHTTPLAWHRDSDLVISSRRLLQPGGQRRLLEGFQHSSHRGGRRGLL